MKKYLISNEGNFYKANMHCHTTWSDAHLSPEEVKDEYKKRGYSIVAYTDHDLFVAHDELADESFLPLHGYEIEITDTKKPWPFSKMCHLCFIALDKSNMIPAGLHREKYMFANAPKYRELMTFGDSVDCDREFTPECTNRLIKLGKENGFFVSYNHPTVSLEDYGDYSKYEGMDALEVYNYGSIVMGYEDINDRVYDDMLRLGKEIAVTGSDDNHNKYPIGHPLCDSFGAFTMIKAKSLTYEAVAEAIKNKDYYASMGPVINSVWYGDGKIRIECEKAKTIMFITGTRSAEYISNGDDGFVTSGEHEVKETDGYVRITVIDHKGRRADTRAFFVGKDI